MIKKTMFSLFLGLFLFSCSDLKTLSEDVKKISQDQSLIIQKLNLLEKKIAEHLIKINKSLCLKLETTMR